MAQSEAAFNNGLRVMFDSAWAPGAIHVSMFFQELVFERRTLLEMSSVSTSSCHSSHAERFTTLAVDKDEHILKCTLAKHVAFRRAPKKAVRSTQVAPS